MDGRYIDTGSTPVMYADDIHSAYSNGETARIVFVERRLQDGGYIYTPCLELVLPVSAIRLGKVTGMLRKAAAQELRAVN